MNLFKCITETEFGGIFRGYCFELRNKVKKRPDLSCTYGNNHIECLVNQFQKDVDLLLPTISLIRDKNKILFIFQYAGKFA